MADDADTSVTTIRWIVAALVVLAVVLLLAYARRNPGFDERVPDPEDAVASLVVNAATT